MSPRRPQHAPYPFTQWRYGKQESNATTLEERKLLDKDKKKFIQQVVGSDLYYGRAIDNTMLPSLNTIALNQSNATEKEEEDVQHFLDYCATHTEATLRFHKSNMILWGSSDASYLSIPKGRIRAAGLFYLSNKPNKNNSNTVLNAPIHAECSVIRHVMSSAAEAELGELFINAKLACAMRNTLNELGHLQPKTPIQIDNATAHGFLHETIKRNQSKAFDMRYYWLRDRAQQGQFSFYWEEGKKNLADYHSKHHPAKHHIAVRSTYLLNAIKSNINARQSGDKIIHKNLIPSANGPPTSHHHINVGTHDVMKHRIRIIRMINEQTTTIDIPRNTQARNATSRTIDDMRRARKLRNITSLQEINESNGTRTTWPKMISTMTLNKSNTLPTAKRPSSYQPHPSTMTKRRSLNFDPIPNYRHRYKQGKRKDNLKYN